MHISKVAEVLRGLTHEQLVVLLAAHVKVMAQQPFLAGTVLLMVASSLNDEERETFRAANETLEGLCLAYVRREAEKN